MPAHLTLSLHLLPRQLSTGFDGKDATAMVLRVHHVLGDGLSLLSVLEAISRPRHAHDSHRCARRGLY